MHAAGFSVEICRKIVEAIQRIFEISEEFNISGILAQIDPEFRDQAYEILISDVQSSDIREECAAYAKKVKRHYFQQKVKEVQELANDYIISCLLYTSLHRALDHCGMYKSFNSLLLSILIS